MNVGKTVHDLLADRTETLEEDEIEAFFVSEKAAYVSRLLDDQPYLLVGSRGVGKSMLLRYTELTADREFKDKRILAVYVTFENSLVMERMQSVVKLGYYDPFRQWSFAKILRDVLAKAEKLKLVTELDAMLEEVFGTISPVSMRVALEKYIKVLENKNISNPEELRKVAKDSLSKTLANDAGLLLDALENANAARDLLDSIIEDNALTRIVFLFDEAAHALVPQQQMDFFTIFKSLRSKNITCKAAVYPAVTYYGKDFDPAHDASRITVDRVEKDRDYIDFFMELLKRRIPSDSELWKKLTEDEEVVRTLCYACFGNPRLLFHLIDIYDTRSKASSVSAVFETCRRFLQDDLWAFHDNTASRSKFETAAKLGHSFIVGDIVPSLAAYNNRWREKDSTQLSIYFTISSDIHNDVKPVLDLLSYSGVIGSRGELKTGQNTTGQLYALNVAIAVAESIIKNDPRTGNSYVREIELVQRERFTQYTKNSQAMTTLVDGLSKATGLICSGCGYRLQPTWRVCPHCESPVPREKSVYFELINHSIDRLFLSERLKNRIRESRKFSTVGEILDSSLDTIDEIYYVGPVRARVIKGAAEEYVAA